MFEFYQDSRYFYIVTELCTGGELFDKIIEEKSFGENKVSLKKKIKNKNYEILLKRQQKL